MQLNSGHLLSDSARLLRRDFDARVRQLGVTGPQARLLLNLATAEGENQGFYAERMEVEPITLCRMIDRMEEAGLVERRRDKADRRAWRVHLTDRSRAMLDRLRLCIAEMQANMLAGFSPAEHDQFNRMMDRIRANLFPTAPAEVPANG